MKLLSCLIPFIALLAVHAAKIDEIAIYGGGPLYSGSNPDIQNHINYLKSSGYTMVIGWAIHVYGNGDLHYNGDLIASNGKYVGDSKWSGYLHQLKSGKTSVDNFYLSVGSGGVSDFTTVASLIKSHGTGSDSILYKNFAALKKAIPEIDGIDLDDEDYIDQNTIVDFSLMLGNIGFKVSFCPYMDQEVWVNSLKAVNSKHSGLVGHFNLQCYAGGEGNDPAQWQKAISSVGLSVPVFPGVMCQQAGGISPQQAQSEFKTWGHEGIKGGFIWLYDNVLEAGPSGEDYASAIKSGLSS